MQAASQHESLACAARAKSWNEYLAKAEAEPGQPKLHRFAKGPPPWHIVHSSNMQDFIIINIQYDTEVRAAPGHKLWVGDQPRLLDYNTSCIATAMQELERLGVFENAGEIRAMSRTFKTNISIGSDWLHLKHLDTLSLIIPFGLLWLWPKFS